MNTKLPRLLNLILAGALTGNELSGLVAVHPALGNLSGEEHIRAEQEIYRRYGRIMPFYMTATVASAIPVLSANRDRRTAEFRLSLAGMACFATMLAVTLTGNVPINRRILELPAREESYEEFLDLRRRWDRLHLARNLLNVAGFTLSSLAALSQSGSGSPAQ